MARLAGQDGLLTSYPEQRVGGNDAAHAVAYEDDVDAGSDGGGGCLGGDFEVDDVVEEPGAEGGDGGGEVAAGFVGGVDEGEDGGVGEGGGEEGGEMFWEGGEGFVVALGGLVDGGEWRGMERTLKPWIKIRRSVFFFMVAFGVGIVVWR